MFHLKPKEKEKNIEMYSRSLYVPQAEMKEEKVTPLSNDLIETRLASLYNMLARNMQDAFSYSALNAPLITKMIEKHYSHKHSLNHLLVIGGFLSKKSALHKDFLTSPLFDPSLINTKTSPILEYADTEDDSFETQKIVEKNNLITELEFLDKLLSQLTVSKKLTECLIQISEFGKLIANNMGLDVSYNLQKPSPEDDHIVRMRAAQSGVAILQSIATCSDYCLPEAQILLKTVKNDIRIALLYRAAANGPSVGTLAGLAP